MLSDRQVIYHLWLAEMWHTAGLTALDPLGQLAGTLTAGSGWEIKFEDKHVFYLQKRRNKEKYFSLEISN
jgi:hypothetical protein